MAWHKAIYQVLKSSTAVVDLSADQTYLPIWRLDTRIWRLDNYSTNFHKLSKIVPIFNVKAQDLL